MDFEIRMVRTAQGPVKLSRERAAYSRLVQEGYSNAAACSAVAWAASNWPVNSCARASAPSLAKVR